MNIARVAFATALLTVFADRLIAAQAVEATLVVPDVRLLPGVPFDFWIELHNRSESVRRVSICKPFQMRLTAGEPVHWTETPGESRTRDQFYWSHGAEAVVGPGETKVLAIPAYSGSMAGAFFRERLFSAPGRRFAIALPLCEQVLTSGTQSAPTILMTTDVEIEILSPAGSDALAWDFLDEKSKGRWTPADIQSPEGRALLTSVLRDHPRSSYAPYAMLTTAVLVFNDSRDRLARQLLTIERFPDSPVVEWLHVEAWHEARALRLHAVMLAEGAILRRSTRPTTRLLAFGHERR